MIILSNTPAKSKAMISNLPPLKLTRIAPMHTIIMLVISISVSFSREEIESLTIRKTNVKGIVAAIKLGSYFCRK